MPSPTLRTLSTLQIHFLLSFPFEALAMNYEPSGRMSSHLADIFTRFVERRLGGGYCLQVNPLYREVLSFLGYRWIGVLGRVYSPISGEWSGLTHTASLVYLDSHVEPGHKGYYLSDVGFGSSPHRPILLHHGREEYGRGSEKFRLVSRTLQPRSTLEETDEAVVPEVQTVANSQDVWILQQSKSAEAAWQDCYSFSTLQCFEPDYHASNKATSHPTAVPFATMILVVRYVLEPSLLPCSQSMIERDGLDPRLYVYHPSVVEQRMIVADKLIVRLGDEEKANRKIESEEERVELLKNQFGLLSHVEMDEALKEIAGKPSRLKARQQVESDEDKSNGTATNRIKPNATLANGVTAH